MRSKMNMIVGVALVVLFLGMGMIGEAKTMTNEAGTVYTQTLMSEMTSSTAAQNATRYADRVGGQGLLVSAFDISLGTNSTVTLVGCTVPQGAILLENAYIEVTTALIPANILATNSIAVGGVTVLASTTNTLASTGIKAAVATAAATTSAAAPVLTIDGGGLTAGVFVLYMPYIQGTNWE